MSEIPNISTERLILRAFDLTDASEVQRLAGHPKVAETTSAVPHPYPDGAAEEWIKHHAKWARENRSYVWAITNKGDSQLIGCISLDCTPEHQRAELGYWIGVEFWNKGYCSEAARPVVQYGLNELRLNKITSRHLATNPASGRIMEKAGMTREGYCKQQLMRGGVFHDMVIYGILSSEL